MTKNVSHRTRIPLTKVELSKIRIRAVRKGLWFRVLSRLERATIDLTLKIVKRIRSVLLARVLTKIVMKLLDAMESRVARLTREVGCGSAQKLSLIAQNWGNKSAEKWMMDQSFWKYLAVMCMNTPSMFKG